MSKFSKKITISVISAIVLVFALVIIRGFFAFNTIRTLEYKGLCITNPPGYFISSDISDTSAFYSISKYNFDKAAIYIGSDFNRIQYESFHFRKFMRISGSSEEVNILATSQDELDVVGAMVRTCS